MSAGECLKHEWMQEQNSSGDSELEDDVCDNLPAVKTGNPNVRMTCRIGYSSNTL
jgi:hypothetical protein